jgi:HPt (histidine-containing phosphotransfer) domain-containing protein
VLQKYLTPSRSHERPAEEVSEELMGIFIESSANNRINLQTALSQQNWEAVHDIAHRVKGSAASFSYSDLSKKAGELQEAIDEERMDEAVELVNELLTEMGRVLP